MKICRRCSDWWDDSSDTADDQSEEEKKARDLMKKCARSAGLSLGKRGIEEREGLTDPDEGGEEHLNIM